MFFFFLGLKKTTVDFYVSIHNILVIKLIGLVICSGEIESLLLTSPKVSSTLNSVIRMISFLLSS